MLTVIFGTMKSGKTSALINYINSTKVAKRQFQVFYPQKDNRFGGGTINSRTGASWEAIPVETPLDILGYIVARNLHSVFVDEVQFLDDNMVKVVSYCIEHNIKIFVSGLLADVNGEIFSTVAKLIPYASKIVQIDGVCQLCGEPSSMVIRRVEGKVDKTNEIIIEGTQSNVEYFAVCPKCFIKSMKED